MLENTFFLYYSWSCRVLRGVLKKIWLERYLHRTFLFKRMSKKNKIIEWKIFQGCFKNKKEKKTRFSFITQLRIDFYYRLHAFTNSITGTQKICAQYWFLCIKIFWIRQCVCLFSALCLVTSSSRSLCCHAHSLAALIFFICFYESQFCSPAINQTLSW